MQFLNMLCINLGNYHRNINEVKQALAGRYCEIDSIQEHSMAISDMFRILNSKLKSSAPRSAPRIIVIGAPGSGKTTLSKLIAKRFNLVYVNTTNLLYGQLAKGNETQKPPTKLIEKGKLISNDIMIDLVKARLSESDCIVNGWVLEGFPKTKEQLEAVLSFKNKPSLTVILELEDNLVFERHEYKKVDPITGQNYNMKELGSSIPKEVLERLVSNNNDKYEVVKKRMKTWNAFLPELDELKDHKLSLNAIKSVEEL